MLLKFEKRSKAGGFWIKTIFVAITLMLTTNSPVLAHDTGKEHHSAAAATLPSNALVQFGVPPMKDMRVGSTWNYGSIVTAGAFGLGTANDQDFPQFLASEVIVIDGSAYVFDQQLNKLVTVPGDLTTPFAVVSLYKSETETVLQENQGSYQAIQTSIEAFLPNGSNLYVLVLTGRFAEVEIAKARGPNPRAEDLISFRNVEGTMVGVYSPSFLGSLTEQPFHFHFITKDRSSGGHVKDVKTDQPVALSFMKAETYTVHWPDSIEYNP